METKGGIFVARGTVQLCVSGMILLLLKEASFSSIQGFGGIRDFRHSCLKLSTTLVTVTRSPK